MTRRLRTLLVALIATLGIAATSPAMAECTGPTCMLRSACGSHSMPMAPKPCCVKAAPQAPAVAPAAPAPASPLVAVVPVLDAASPLAFASPRQLVWSPAHGHRARPLRLLLSTFLI